MIERAIIQQVIRRGDGSSTVEAYSRPQEVRAQATRVQNWLAGKFDACTVCRADAVYLRTGVAYCATHRDELRFDIDPRPGRLAATLRAEASPRELSGMAIVFDKWSVDLGGFRERIRSSAVDRTLREGTDLRALWSHEPSETIGRIQAGTLAVRKATEGLAVAIDPPRWADRHVESIERRDISGMSFAFSAIDDEWFLEDRMPRRTVLDMDVSEVSVVAFPAYPQTSIKLGPASLDFKPSRSWRERAARV